MNIRQLECFVTIAESKNITQAAKRLFVSQPPMSRQIALLEEELGTKLLIRTNRGVELTNAGTILYTRSKAFLSNLQDTMEAVREAEEGIRGKISVGVIYSAIPCFAEKLHKFQQEYPNIDFYIEPNLPSELLINLKKGTVDVAFLRAPMSDTGNLPYIILGEEAMVLAIHEDMDPCPASGSIDIKSLKGIPFCSQVNTDNLEYRNWDYNAVLNHECMRHGFLLNSIYECNGVLSAFMLACAGLAACYIPVSVPKLFGCGHVHLKKVRGINSTTAPLLLWSNTRYISRCLQLFLDYFKK